MPAVPAGEESKLRELLAPFRAGPDRAAVLLDVDGTLAPIAPRPDAAEVPAATRELLRRLGRSYALVGCVSGRPALDARRLVGVEEIHYSGNHGFELLGPGEAEPRADPAIEGHEGDAAAFLERVEGAELDRLGIRIEDKGAIVALHWRGSRDEAEAEAFARGLAEDCEREGLIPHFGRKVLEVRPGVSIDKGRALGSLLGEADVAAALYAGDDRTDLDAFAALERMLAAGSLEAKLAVAIAAGEAPDEVAAAADLVVAGPEGFLAVLEELVA